MDSLEVPSPSARNFIYPAYGPLKFFASRTQISDLYVTAVQAITYFV